jgi:hypothetical protein
MPIGPVSQARYSDVRLTDRIGIGVLTRVVRRDLVDEVLVETGRKEMRSRSLPARVVVYYVMALSLFFGDAYEEVVRRLVGGLQFLGSWRKDWKVPTTSAISQARSRLGEAPMRALFERVATPLASASMSSAWYHSWRLMAIDGVVLDVPDTPANAAEFGRSANSLAASAYPQVRILGLAECGTHAMVAASIGAMSQYERELAADLFPALTDDMLVLADRGFYSYDFWEAARATGADLLWRVKNQIVLPAYEWLPDGSYRSALLPKSMRSDMARGKYRRIDRYEIPVRVIEYQITNRDNSEEVIRLVTSLTDHELCPAAELAALYHKRWEFELILDEIETHQTGHPRVLRSKTPDLVKQEIWGLLLSHYAIRHLMAEAAENGDTDPDRLSFIRSLRVVRRHITEQAAFSPQPTQDSDQDSDQRD